MHSPSGKEKLLQEKIVQEAKDAWSKKLINHKLIDKTDTSIFNKLKVKKPLKNDFKTIEQDFTSNQGKILCTKPERNALSLSNPSLLDDE